MDSAPDADALRRSTPAIAHAPLPRQPLKKHHSCDGEGRMLGGLGAVPGFGWWPIKAYRPCPNLEKAGVDYVR